MKFSKELEMEELSLEEIVPMKVQGENVLFETNFLRTIKFFKF